MTATLDGTADFTAWRSDVRSSVCAYVERFVDDHGTEHLNDTGVDIAADVLSEFLADGKCLRSTFLYVGWLCGRPDDDAAVRAAASLELLHAFALLQDDVMDQSPLRRGRPAAHVRFATWHRARALPGSSERFGESAAVLLGDLCLVWAEQMLRGSGLDAEALTRAWPRYDAMRTELAVGQFADLANTAAEFPTLEHVLDVSRRKSGNYTVRRPLEIGSALADCSREAIARLGGYGDAIGEAFQLRDDLLGVFGAPATTGKPSGSDLAEQKATSVVVAAHELADRTTRRELSEFMKTPSLAASDVVRWRAAIEATGAPEYLEQLISRRLGEALDWIDSDELPSDARATLTNMAAISTARSA